MPVTAGVGSVSGETSSVNILVITGTEIMGFRATNWTEQRRRLTQMPQSFLSSD